MSFAYNVGGTLVRVSVFDDCGNIVGVEKLNAIGMAESLGASAGAFMRAREPRSGVVVGSEGVVMQASRFLQPAPSLDGSEGGREFENSVRDGVVSRGVSCSKGVDSSDAVDGGVVERCDGNGGSSVGVARIHCVDGVEEPVGNVSGVTFAAGRTGGGSVADNAVCGTVSENVSEKTLKNRKRRQDAKLRKKRRQAGASSKCEYKGFKCDDDLSLSLKAKYIAQNELAVFRAQRDLEIMKAVDLNGEVRRQQTKINAHTEKNMVAIERAHGLLKSTGNVPGEGILSHDHDVHTVVDSSPGLSDGNTGSISPDSSASQAEFRACQKALLDSEAKIKRFEEMFSKLNLPCGFDERFDKETFTDNTDGGAAMEIVYPGLPFYEVVRDGISKMKVGVNFE